MQSTRPHSADGDGPGVREQLRRGTDEARDLGGDVAEIVAGLRELASREAELAKAELSEQLALAGRAAAGFALAGVLAFVVLGCLAATAILVLANAVDEWLAALIVTLVIGGLATGAGAFGWRALREIRPGPQEAMRSVREDVRWARRLLKRSVA